MRRVAIVTDSGSDLPARFVEQAGIHIVPLYVTIGTETKRDGLELSSTALCRLMEIEGASPMTSQPAPEDFRQAYVTALETADEVVCITLSAGVSGTHQSATLGKEELDQRDSIYIVDSRSASLGSGLLAITAARLRDEGQSAAAIAGHLEALNVNALFTVEDLKYLERGGRISRTSASLGKILNVKPVLALSRATEGKIASLTKVRGKQKAIKFLVDETVGSLPADYSGLLGICHADCIEEVQQMSLSLRTSLPKAEIIISEIGAAIGAHTGPGSLAVFFFAG